MSFLRSESSYERKIEQQSVKRFQRGIDLICVVIFCNMNDRKILLKNFCIAFFLIFIWTLIVRKNAMPFAQRVATLIIPVKMTEVNFVIG